MVRGVKDAKGPRLSSVMKCKCNIDDDVSSSKARQVVEQYAAWQVETITPHTVLSASELQERYQLPFRDSLILAAARQGGAAMLLSEDLSHGQIVEGVRIENPLLSSP